MRFLQEGTQLLRRTRPDVYQNLVEPYVREILLQADSPRIKETEDSYIHVMQIQLGTVFVPPALWSGTDREYDLHQFAASLPQEADHIRWYAEIPASSILTLKGEQFVFPPDQRSPLTPLEETRTDPYSYLLEISGHLVTIETLLSLAEQAPPESSLAYSLLRLADDDMREVSETFDPLLNLFEQGRVLYPSGRGSP